MQTLNQGKHDDGGGNRSEKSWESQDDNNFSIAEEILEKIMARILFPGVLKIPLLSNSWNRKFSCPWEYSEDRDSRRPRKRLHLTPLQEEITSVSHKWPSYSPVYLTSEGIRGFDLVSSQWKLISSRCKSMFPDRNLKWNSRLDRWTVDTKTGHESVFSCGFVGSLVLVSILVFSDETRMCQSVLVLSIKNVITGSSTKMRREMRPEKNERLLVARLLPGGSNTSYRLLQSTRVMNENLRRHELLTSVYDSEVGGWSNSTTSVLLPDFVGDLDHPLCRSNVYLHGKLYCLCIEEAGRSMLLCVNHVDSDKTWTFTRFPFDRYICALDYICHAGVLLCHYSSEKLMVVIYTNCHEIFTYDMDMKFLGLRVRSRSVSRQRTPMSNRFPNWVTCLPSDRFSIERIEFASDDDFVYISSSASCSRGVVTYNMHCGEWGNLPPTYSNIHSKLDDDKSIDIVRTINIVSMLSSPFIPGLNPFAIVEQRSVVGRRVSP